MPKVTGKKKAGRPTKGASKTGEAPGGSKDSDYIPLERESSSSGSEIERIRRRIRGTGGKRIVEEDPQDGEEACGEVSIQRDGGEEAGVEAETAEAER